MKDAHNVGTGRGHRRHWASSVLHEVTVDTSVAEHISGCCLCGRLNDVHKKHMQCRDVNVSGLATTCFDRPGIRFFNTYADGRIRPRTVA
jgi:hypothetical protein